MIDGKWIITKSDEEAVKQGCYFDLAAAERVRNFFRKFLRHSIGGHAGMPFELLDWQWDRVIAPAFGWKMPDGTRRFKEVELWIPKKNGKSTLIAGVVLYMMCADKEPGSHVYSAASDRKQAGIVYREVAAMVRQSPELIDILKVRDSQKRIMYNETASFYEVLAADCFRNEGLNIHGLAFDELHTQPNRYLWDTLRYGTSARRQGIKFVMSTAGVYDEESLWWERFSAAKRIQNSEEVDIHLLPIVYAMDDEKEDWHDPNVWRRVNPSWGETINPVEFERDYANALRSGTNESAFLRYRLNKATKHESAWIATEYWTQCKRGEQQRIEPLSKGFRYSAVDLSDHLDLTGFVDIYEAIVDEQPRINMSTMFWAPSQPANKLNAERYDKWNSMGLIKLIPGPVAKQERVEDDIVKYLQETRKTLPPMKEIGVDRFNATRFAYSMQDKLVAASLPPDIRLVAYNAPTLNEALKHLEGLILEGILIHDNSHVMRWMFHNCIAAMDSSGNRKLDKAKSKGKIDGFAALLMAVYLAINKEGMLFSSKYNTLPLQTLTVR